MTLIQTALPGYRRAFVADLRERLGDRLHVAAGGGHLDPSVVTAVPPAAIDQVVRNHFLLGRRLIYQRGWLRAVRGRGVWVLEMNPRIVNTWLAVLLGRVLRRRTLLWGHFRGRAQGEKGPRFARRLQIFLASGVLAYTDEEGRAFAAMFPRREVHVAPNAVDRAADLPAPPEGAVRDSFLSVSRLIAGKGLDLLVDGFAHARAHDLLPSNARLVLVGDGPERDALAARVAALPEGTDVFILRGTFDPELLAAHYHRAVAGVCGGYVGLNITQSLVRGVPFVYPTHSNHSPEVSLAASTNSFPFDDVTPAGIASAMAAVWRATAEGRVHHALIQRDTLARYSVESMVQGFVDAVRG